MQQGERALARSPCLVSTVAPLPSFRFQSEACGFLDSTQPLAAGKVGGATRATCGTLPCNENKLLTCTLQASYGIFPLLLLLQSPNAQKRLSDIGRAFFVLLLMQMSAVRLLLRGVRKRHCGRGFRGGIPPCRQRVRRACGPCPYRRSCRDSARYRAGER